MSEQIGHINEKREFIWKDMTFEIIKTQEDIQARNQEIANQITTDLKGKKPIFIAVLTGAFIFLSDVIRKLEWFDFEVEFLRYSSYENNSQSNNLKELIGIQNIKAQLKDRHIVIFEDIVDSGLTLLKVKELIQKENPASIRTATFLQKPDCLKHNVICEYVGFKIAPEFVVGYGLDVDEQARNLPSLYALKK